MVTRPHQVTPLGWREWGEIQVKPKNVEILHDNCLRCHGDFVHEILAATSTERLLCTQCHLDVGHQAKE